MTSESEGLSLPPSLESAVRSLVGDHPERFTVELAKLCADNPAHATALCRLADDLRPPERASASGRRLPRLDQRDARSLIGQRTGPFQLLDLLGEGGMGVVYLAEQREPMRRRVAVKVIKFGMDTQAVLARFEAERQALAIMNHSNIAKVLEAGVTDDGRPWFAMEYVPGLPITKYCDSNRVPIEARLQLFRQVCSGVQHAHTKGVIHRDLSANNILVTLQDGRPSAKIIDFGLARATDNRLTERTLYTELGVVAGTPEYMSPEQAGLDSLDIDMRSDVYTLGVVLYELLTGCLPFDSARLRAAGYDGLCRIIRETEPPKPSARVADARATTGSVAHSRHTDLSSLLSTLRGDLDWVVMKCLEKDRTRRYETVAELAADIGRHLDHEPVLAHAPSAWYQLSKVISRYRRAAVMLSLVLASILVGSGVAVVYAAEANRQSARAADAVGQLERKVEDYEFLAGGHEARDLIRSTVRSLPAQPEHVPALQGWCDAADQLLARCASIEAAMLRMRRTGSVGPLASDREVLDSQRRRLEKATVRAAALARSLALRRGGVLEPYELDAKEREQSPGLLNHGAWERNTPDLVGRIWGDERRGLAMAELGWQGAADGALTRVTYQATLAWAWLMNGNEPKGVAYMEAARDAAPTDQRATYAEELEWMRAWAANLERIAEDARTEKAWLASQIAIHESVLLRDPKQRFLYDSLVTLAFDLDDLGRKHRPVEAARLRFAEHLQLVGVDHPRGRVRWVDMVALIAASDRYKGLRLVPQCGLVPLGINPATGLAEFYDLRSAWDPQLGRDVADLPIPSHDAAGHIAVGQATGIVFVLLPGGRFMMGEQGIDPAAPNFDPQANRISPPHAIDLAPFFLGRHEVTQAQWSRLTHGASPSAYRAGGVVHATQPRLRLTCPVDSVDWATCCAVLAQAGMTLPTEAQWEYGCRGGTSWPWWTGTDRNSLLGAANIADAAAARATATWPEIADWPEYDDGFAVNAPVDTLRVNPCGLHHVHGNVGEWCLDVTGPYSLPVRPGDGLRLVAVDGPMRQYRGGSHQTDAKECRSSQRGTVPMTRADAPLGLRAARQVQL